MIKCTRTRSNGEDSRGLNEHDTNVRVTLLLASLQMQHHAQHYELADEDERVEYLRYHKPPYV